MNKIILVKRNSAIFLATLLVLGTIVTILPSTQAQPYYEDTYEADYPSYSQDYEQEYLSYKPDYKSKDSSSSVINKIKCNNINSNNNGVDVSLGVPNNDDAIAEAQAADNEGQATSANEWGYGNEYKQNGNDFRFVCINNNDNENNIVGNGTTPEPPIPNPRITVIKEMFICSEPTVREAGQFDGFTNFDVFCGDPNTASIPDPDSPVWIPWEDCNVAGFCENFSEEDFTMQIEQNPGPNFIRYEFPVTNEGRSVNVESGTFQISEEGTDPSGTCPNPSYEGAVIIANNPPQPPLSIAFFCFILEGDCSDTIEAGEEKTCTVKNYLRYGNFQVPTESLTASNINTATSAFDINTDINTNDLQIAQETGDSTGLTALEKTTKLKQQWLDLLP